MAGRCRCAADGGEVSFWTSPDTHCSLFWTGRWMGFCHIRRYRINARTGAVLLSGARLLLHQNKAKGFACVSCAWAKPKSHAVEFCENGAKATAWEIDAHRATSEFFAIHSVNDLLEWSDYQLEAQGRLTHPLRWDKATDKYLPLPWKEAFRQLVKRSSHMIRNR
jgi:anaerobic selenocysteine-containing dehydrogenase